jgi:hypothetical protein
MTDKCAAKDLPMRPDAAAGAGAGAGAPATGLRTGVDASNRSFHFPAPIHVRAPRALFDKSVSVWSAERPSSGTTDVSPAV